MQRYNASPADYAAFLQSMIRLDALDKMTQNLDEELADSQRIMREIKVIFDSVPMKTQNGDGQPVNELRHEDISKFLEADTPKLLLPDMVENTDNINLDDVIAQMKVYAEDLKKNIIAEKQEPLDYSRTMQKLDLDKYATSLDQLSKRLANIKLNRDGGSQRNPELEAKLSQLCQDVNMFTQMVEAKTTLSECNKNWLKTEQNTKALQYDNVVNKLLAGINELTYLLQNKN